MRLCDSCAGFVELCLRVGNELALGVARDITRHVDGLFGNVQRQGLRLYGIVKCGGDLENPGVARNAYLQDRAFERRNRLGARKFEMLNGVKKKAIARCQQFVALERFEIDGTQGHGDTRIGSRGRLNEDAGGCGIARGSE